MMKRITKIFSVVLGAALTFTSLTFFSGAKEVKATDEPVKTADVYFIAGQSNGVGSTKIKGDEKSGYPGVDYSLESNNPHALEVYDHVLYAGQSHALTNGTPAYEYNTGDDYFTPVRLVKDDGVTKCGTGYTINHIGPEYGMAQYLEPIYAAKENTDAVIIKYASGGTGLTAHWETADSEDYCSKSSASLNDKYGTWYPESLWEGKDQDNNPIDYWNKFDRYYADGAVYGQTGYLQRTGLMYRKFIDFIREKIPQLTEAGYKKINIKSMIWMQGETDRGVPVLYKNVFKTFCEDVRNRVSEITGQDCSAMPVICGEISETFGSADSRLANETFITMQNKLCETIRSVYTINSGKFLINGENGVLGSDSAHWAFKDMVEMGHMFAEKSLEADEIDGSRWLFTQTSGFSRNMIQPSGEIIVGGDGTHSLQGKDKIDFTVKCEAAYKLDYFRDGETNILSSATGGVSAGERVYNFSLDVPESGDIDLSGLFVDANKYKVTISVTNQDQTYGMKLYKSSYPEFAYEGADYAFDVRLTEIGQVEKVTVNGTEIGVSGGSHVTVDNIDSFVTEGTKNLAIEVTYGPKSEPEPVTPDDPTVDPEPTPEGKSSSGGCAGKAMEVLTLVFGMCAAAFVVNKSRNV